MLRLTFDEKFQKQILPQIEFFFRRTVVSESSKSSVQRVQRGAKLYQHGGWKNK